MDLNFIDGIVKVSACVCGKDGVISRVEEDSIYQFIHDRYPEYLKKRFESVLDEFFLEDIQIETYISDVKNFGLNSFVVELCRFSAGSDGLDIKENIALDKVKKMLGESK
jgi:hypothetical protein